jgi:hypothetical protein
MPNPLPLPHWDPPGSRCNDSPQSNPPIVGRESRHRFPFTPMRHSRVSSLMTSTRLNPSDWHRHSNDPVGRALPAPPAMAKVFQGRHVSLERLGDHTMKCDDLSSRCIICCIEARRDSEKATAHGASAGVSLFPGWSCGSPPPPGLKSVSG